MNIKNLFDRRSSEEKIKEYRELRKQLGEISLRTEELADEFSAQSGIFKSVFLLEGEEKEDVDKRYDAFLKEHTKKVAALQRDKSRIEKALSTLEKDEKIQEAIFDIKDLEIAKNSYKKKKITKAVYNDIIKAKTGKVRYADVLLFRGSKLLILQRAGEKGSYSDNWCIPGGHVDAGEDFKEAAQRELFEETGIEIPEDLLMEVGVATGKNFEIHYFMGHVDDESPISILVDSEEEIGSAWINPSTELDDYNFIFDMKDNIKKILGLEIKPSVITRIFKAYTTGEISEKVFTDFCKSHPEEIKKANNKTYFSHKERKDLADKGEAMPNGKYPIRNSQDLKDAIRLSGASDMPEEKVKAWIKKRAKALGLEAELPDDWKDTVEKTMDCESSKPLVKEELDKEIKVVAKEEPKENKIEKSTDSFSLLINFNDLDQADMFKSLLNEMKNEGKLDIESILDDKSEIEKALGFGDIEKAEPALHKTFADYANFLEGVKTRAKNVHWGELDNSKHVYLDDLMDELSDYEDKVMEAGQSEFGRFKDGEISGEEIEVNDPVELVDLIMKRTQGFYDSISEDINYVGEKSWTEDFLASLKQTKYRLQMH